MGTSGAGYEQRLRRARGAFASQLHGLSDDELVVAAKKVAETVASPGWEVIEQLVLARADLWTAQVIHGPTLERHEVAAITGTIGGLEQAVFAPRVVEVVAREREEQLAQSIRDREA
jgi:hypothetical protein